MRSGRPKRDEVEGTRGRVSGIRSASGAVDECASLDRALCGTAAVINCAGPFIDTATPVIEAALRSGVHYLDVAAEQAAVLSVFERFGDATRMTPVVIAPAMAFYGGLGDLLATAGMGNWAAADEICVAVALDSWKPTRGTQLTGQRNPGKRFVFSNGRLGRGDPAPPRTWNFPPPFGQQDVAALPFSETITISRHLQVPEIRAYMNLPPIADIRDPNTSEPTPADESGRSSQIFVVDVSVRRGAVERRAMARGRDIYAITAPIVVEATQRVVNGLANKVGVAAAGELFDAQDFLKSLSGADLSFEIKF